MLDIKFLLITFAGLMLLFIGVAAIVLRWVFVSNTDGAIQRLNEEIGRATAKQSELSSKIKKADEELVRRQNEARELTSKMKTEAEEQSKSEREQIITKAREEADEIIEKAQKATVKIKHELEKESDNKIVDQSMALVNDVLSLKAKGTLNNVLVQEFLNKIKEVDMSRIDSEVSTVDIITLSDIDQAVKDQFSQIIAEKLNRSVTVNVKADAQIGGGVILKFGSIALDGSLKNLIREEGAKLKDVIEERRVNAG